VGRPKGSARPSLKPRQLTKWQLQLLQLLADDISPLQIAEHRGIKVRPIYQTLSIMRLKLSAFTTGGMIGKAFRDGLIK